MVLYSRSLGIYAGPALRRMRDIFCGCSSGWRVLHLWFLGWTRDVMVLYSRSLGIYAGPALRRMKNSFLGCSSGWRLLNLSFLWWPRDIVKRSARRWLRHLRGFL